MGENTCVSALIWVCVTYRHQINRKPLNVCVPVTRTKVSLALPVRHGGSSNLSEAYAANEFRVEIKNTPTIGFVRRIAIWVVVAIVGKHISQKRTLQVLPELLLRGHVVETLFMIYNDTAKGIQKEV